SKDSVSILSNDAINSYRQSITINPDSAATYQNMAALFHNTGQTDSEIVYWNLARQHKNDPLFTSYIIDGYIRLGDEATTKGDTATEHKDDLAAVAELQKAFQDNPNDTLLLPAMINLYIKLGRTADAMPYMKKALDNNPNDKTLQNNYGLLLLQQGNFQEAIDHIGMVLKADSNDIDGLRNESVAYLRLGEQKKKAEMDKAAKGGKVEKTYLSDFQNAAHLLERLTSIKSDDADLYEALGTAYANCGMNKQAEAALKSADRLRKK
ncbi:MAG TPA: tetratricopeptide repeat protein, partial [Bacteroidota bacterium]|nr:tetratricopeptide repeat protein [Bacteroidota bacterium]